MDQTPIPGEKWHWVNPLRSSGVTSSILFVNFARGDMPGGYEVTQPLRREMGRSRCTQSERFSSDYIVVSSP